MVPGGLEDAGGHRGHRVPVFQGLPEAQGRRGPLEGAVPAHGRELGQGHAGGVDAGAHPHISRPGQGGQALTLVRLNEKQGLELGQGLGEHRIIQVAPHQIIASGGAAVSHRQGRTPGAVIGQVIHPIKEQYAPQAYFGPGGEGDHLLLQVGRDIGPEPPGQPRKEAIQGQGPGIQADPGQVGEDLPAQPADVSAQGLSVAASQFLRVAPDFQRA